MFFKIDLDWLLDLEPIEALLYGIIYSADTKSCRVDSNGIAYKRIPNRLINYWFPKLSKYKIAKLLTSIEDANYAKTLFVKKPSATLRFISIRQYNINEGIFIFKDWLNEYQSSVCIALGVMFKQFRFNELNGEVDLDDIVDFIPTIYSELRAFNLLDSDNCPTDKLIEMFELTNEQLTKKGY